jgi:putative Holliday junction resolvase
MKKRIMALDFGEKRIGVAVSDYLGIIARPYTTITFSCLSEAIGQIKEICDKEQIGQIVIGLPVNLKGKIGLQAKKTQQFVQAMQKEIRLPMVFQDERFSSKEAEKILTERGIKGRKNKVDALAAVLILNHYLERDNV